VTRVHDLGQLTELAVSLIGEINSTRAKRQEHALRKTEADAELAAAKADESSLGMRQRQVNTQTNEFSREAAEASARLLEKVVLDPESDLDRIAEKYASLRLKVKLASDAVTYNVTRLMPAARLRVLKLELARAEEIETLALYDALIARIEVAIAMQPVLDAEGAVELSGGRSEFLFRAYLDAGRATRAASQALIDESSRQAEMARSGAIASL
jgi:hypothetical protein